MTQAGGSATMYGILYQLLGTAYWTGAIHLEASADDGEWTDARITIEPSGGGGDDCVESIERRIVEQWKAKSDHGAWALRNVIEDVLPDLYRAVDLAIQHSEFRFVTEGHRGRWDSAEQFFAELHDTPAPDDPFSQLDDSQPVSFFQGESLTKLQFFRHILVPFPVHELRVLKANCC